MLPGALLLHRLIHGGSQAAERLLDVFLAPGSAISSSNKGREVCEVRAKNKHLTWLLEALLQQSGSGRRSVQATGADGSPGPGPGLLGTRNEWKAGHIECLCLGAGTQLLKFLRSVYSHLPLLQHVLHLHSDHSFPCSSFIHSFTLAFISLLFIHSLHILSCIFLTDPASPSPRATAAFCSFSWSPQKVDKEQTMARC
jgi:hypothetical protein